MSKYASLACDVCRVQLWLGRVVAPAGESPYFDSGGTPSSQDQQRTRALWKLLAEHIGHSLRVVREGDSDYDHICGYPEIGGDTVDDLPFEEYLKNWRG